MHIARHRLVAVAIAASALAAGCSDDENKTDAPSKSTAAAPVSAVDRWNAERSDKGFDESANQRALAVLRRIAQAGVTCTGVQTESFSALRSSYQTAELPLPLGSASCTGPEGENVLVEVFPTQPPVTLTDFVARKRELVCAKGRELGQRPDGSNDFPGLPYVEDRASGWIIEPDSSGVNRRIADVLDLTPKDVCAEEPASR